MFGHLPLIVKEVVLNHGGNEKWENVLKRLGLTEDFQETHIYDERMGEQLINEAINITNMRRELFFEVMGETYCANMVSKENSQSVRLLGGSFYEFIQNLDFLHTTAMAKYPKADIPLFRMDTEGASLNKMRLHYYSKREFLSRMVESLLRCIGKTVFKKEIDIRIISENHEDDRYHVIYSVILDEFRMEPEVPPTMVAQTKKHGENQLHNVEVEHQKEKLDHLRMEFGDDALPVNRFRSDRSKLKASTRMLVFYKNVKPRIPASLLLDAADFCDIFPYHIIFDSSMNLKQAGIQMQLIVQEFRDENESITKHLELVHPGRCDFNFFNIQKYIACPHVLKTRHNNLTGNFTPKGGVLYFRGQMIELSNKHLILYLCSPYVHNLDAIEQHGMHISDIPTHDVTKYLFQGSQAIECFKRRTNKGDWLEGFLGSNGQPIFDDDLDGDLGEHRFAMVPRGIADVMKTGQRVEGKMYRNCSILFCDLVQFGMIVQHASPTEVLTMLNDLHDKFDRLAEVHDVFKVDVIGDAYVIVSGIPTPIRNHAERIAKMALAMLYASRLTPCPYNYGSNIGARVLARIGLHSGDVIGGVIGRPVHRFTIMGENVVMASRMESHGIPDRVHLSESLYSELKPFKFEVESRGNIEIRGKGRLYTYLLKENQAINKDVIMGERKRLDDTYPLAMSPDRDQRVSFAPTNRPGSESAMKVHQPRQLRPKSGRNK